MNSQRLSRRFWLALSLLAIAYTLLGWYLAAHDVFGVGIFVVITTLVIAWKSNPILEFLTWLIKQQVLFVIGMSLVFSVVVALTLVKPMLLSLIPLPLITLLYALLETRALEFKQSNVFLWLAVITIVGLGLGEVVDLFVIAPSLRY